jgi:nucleotide-binding universal stress UspA family protein
LKILHPTDFSECAMQAQKTAVELVGRLTGEIVLLHVLVEPPLYSEGIRSMMKPHIVVPSEQEGSIYEAQRKWTEQTLEGRTAELRQRGIKARWRVQVGVPFEEIVKIAAEERVDMIALGTHGRGGVSRLLMGSVADRVIRLAPCSVLTVREATSEAGR